MPHINPTTNEISPTLLRTFLDTLPFYDILSDFPGQWKPCGTELLCLHMFTLFL